MAAQTPIPKRINFQITIVSGTPERLASVNRPRPLYATELFIQSRSGNTGLGYVLGGIPLNVVPNAADPAHLTSELAASPSAVIPGGAFGEPTSPAGGFNTGIEVDLREYALDGTHSGDVFIVTYYLRD